MSSHGAETSTESCGQGNVQNKGNGSSLRNIAGWILTVIVLLYAAWIHNGVGVAPSGNPTRWWHATGDLLATDTVDAWVVTQNDEGRSLLWTPGIVYLTIPALLLGLFAILVSKSAVARALACSAAWAVPIFVFYGLTGAVRIWEFFHWRASVVMVGTALALGFTMMAPALAQSWLRQRSWVKWALYLPLFLAIVLLVRHATGTDESLPFNFSPWPAIPVLGLEIGAYLIIGVVLGIGVGIGASSVQAKAPRLATFGMIAGVLLPAIWYASRFGATEGPAILGLALVAGAGIAIGVLRRESQRFSLSRRATAFLVGGTLAFAPLATGRALATGDYVVNKFVHSKTLIDALALYYQDSEEGYPDDLQTLVDKGYLDAIPTPRLGFGLYYTLGLDKPYRFFYQSLGSSYVLEFTSTEWVQCGYNPPWDEEDEFMEDEEEDEDYDDEDYDDDEDEEEDDEGGGDAWNCPDERPELW